MKRVIFSLIMMCFIIRGGCLVAQENIKISTSAKYVWADEEGGGRQDYVYFRNDFKLNGVPKEAKINLFVDSRYHLYVNGTFINFGPARSYPQEPVFDTYDIAPFLNEGANVIAVKALSNGINTYQVPKSIGGFIAWGEIEYGKSSVSLSTPGDWTFIREKAYDEKAPKMSFATGPVEIFNENKAVRDWNKLNYNPNGWEDVKILTNQNHWGSLKARNIPHLTQDEYIPERLVGAYKLNKDETIYSFRKKFPDFTRHDINTNNWMYGYTYIHSPKDQKVQVGLWWGEYWLNGMDVKPDFGKQYKRNVWAASHMDLKKGWNFFFVGYGVFQALWDFYMSVPDSANLTFNPSKEMDSDVFFMTSGPFNGDMYELSGRSEIRFQSHKDLPREMGWEPQLKSKRANNPAWDIAWQKLDQSLDISAHKVSDFKISSGEETALFFDMGGKKLGRIFIEYDAPKGTTVDIAFSEDLKDGRPSVLKRPGIYTATRHIAAEGENYFETFKPYGLRYLHVNITGNKGDVKLKRIGVKSQIYPFERVGSFECSDPLFNGLWELGWRTLEVCSEDTYTDTPFRERGLYAGDALPEYAITLATSGDSRLMKRSLEVLQHMYADLFFPDTEKPDDTPGTIFDFPFISLEYFRWSVEYTEDMEFAKKLYPRYKYLVESALKLRDDRGLLDHPRVFIEWTQIDKNAQLTAMQGIFARSLKNMSVLADMLDKPKEAERYKQLEDEMVMAINKYCYDDETGAYRDGFKDGKAIDNYYPISSAWMSLNNYSPEEREKQLADFYAAELEDIGDVSRQRKTTPYGGFYVMGALFNQGYVDVAEEFIRKYYGPFVLKHDDTAWENFDDGSQGQGQGTLSHAWSGGPTYYFTTEILGVKLGFPYYYNPGKVEISPQSKSVNWAKGTVPHPEGVISVSWKIKGDNLFLDYSGPSGIDYTVRPKGRLAKYNLIVNGRKMH